MALVSVLTEAGCIYTPIPTLPPDAIRRTVPLETLKQMSLAEQQGRYSPALQTAFKNYYEAVKRQGVDASFFNGDIIEMMQRDVLEQFGFSRDDDAVLYELRTAAMQYPEETLFQDSIYIKFNRCADCVLQNGDPLADTPLYDALTLKQHTLSELVHHYVMPPVCDSNAVDAYIRPTLVVGRDVEKSPLVVVTGSYT